MKHADAMLEDRALDLLADRALGTLSDADARELASILARLPDLETDALDVAAAAIDLAWMRGALAPLPEALGARVHAAVDTEMSPPRLAVVPRGEPRARAESAPRARTALLAWSGWLAAAAALAIALGASWSARAPGAYAARERARIMGAAESVQIALAPSADPAAAGASGDVVWNPAEQRGFVRLRGVAPNDRARAQYQLWIVDAARDARYPVDGGVFDVPRIANDSGPDVLIPIRAKLAVARAAAFVITVETPGGAVVSRQERVVMRASL